MNVMDYIMAEKIRQEMTNEEFAKKLPFSRQRYEELVKQKDCQFRIVRTMLNALGKDIDVLTREGGEPPFDKAGFFAQLESTNVFFGKEKAVVETMGLAFYIVPAGASESAPMEEKILL